MTRRATTSASTHGKYQRAPKYRAPLDIRRDTLNHIIESTGRTALEKKQLAFLRPEQDSGQVPIYFTGDLSLLDRPCVAIVGSRAASEPGLARATRLARELAHGGFVVVSGLAAGIDAAAHSAAIQAGGSTIAVIGTPLDRAYPAENARLQEIIYTDHLLLSPFHIGERTFKSNFPLRNRVMAALTDATIIVEASDTSGTLHQAAECTRLGRWLFIAKSLVDAPDVTWPTKFLSNKRAAVLSDTSQIIETVLRQREYSDEDLP